MNYTQGHVDLIKAPDDLKGLMELRFTSIMLFNQHVYQTKQPNLTTIESCQLSAFCCR